MGSRKPSCLWRPRQQASAPWSQGHPVAPARSLIRVQWPGGTAGTSSACQDLCFLPTCCQTPTQACPVSWAAKKKQTQLHRGHSWGQVPPGLTAACANPRLAALPSLSFPRLLTVMRLIPHHPSSSHISQSETLTESARINTESHVPVTP